MMMMRRSGCSLMMMVMIKVLIGALLCKNYATGELTFRRSPLGPDTSGLHSGLSLLNIHSGEWGWKNGKRLQPLAEKQQRVQPELVRCWEIPAPLCTTCFLAFRDGKEAPWWPNARDRLQVVLPHVTPLPERCMRLITEFARPGWAT